MHSIIPAQGEKDWDIMDIVPSGINTRDTDISLAPDECNSMKNAMLVGRGLEKRKGVDVFGDAQTGDKVVGLDYFESDAGIVPLAMVDQTLYKYVSGNWVAGDKTDYTANLDTSMIRFNSKSGSAIDSGTTTSGSTTYLLEDASATWELGEHQGRCVVIEGEIKYIADNTETTLIIGEKLNSNTDSDYQSKGYEIYDLSPHVFILNGTDSPAKYDLTNTTDIDGTHVTDGKAFPLAKVGTVHQGRMWLATGSGDNNDRVFLTDIGVGENITTDTNLNVNLQFLNDGDRVENIGSMELSQGSACIVAKTESIHVVEGENILNYTTRPIVSNEGCFAKKSFAVGKGTAFFLGKDGKVISLSDIGDGPLSDPLPISRPIQEDIRAQSVADQQNACATIHDNKYFLRVGSLMWYYDIERSLSENRHVWIDISFAAGAINFNVLSSIDAVLYGGAEEEGQIYSILTSNDDSGEDIEMVLDFGEISLPDHSHIWVDRIEVLAEKEENTVLSFDFLTDGGSFGVVQSATLDSNELRYVFNVQQRCRSIRPRFSERGTNAPVRINRIKIFFKRSDAGENATKG